MAEATPVANPRRILAVSLEDATHHLARIVKDLTGKTPEPVATSLAGTTHDLPLSTAYYSATVPVWIDLIASPSDWAASFLSEEAAEVLAVLGGLLLVFPLPGTTSPEPARELIRHVGKVVQDGLGGWEWDGVGVAVGVGEGSTEEWDELCAEAGLEFVQVKGTEGEERNEFGEKSGIPRVREAFEANDWAQLDGPSLSDFGDFEDAASISSTGKDGDKDLDPESLDFGFDKADFEGLRKAIWSSGQVDDDGPATTTAEEERMTGGVRGTINSNKDDTEPKGVTGVEKGQDESSRPDDDEVVKVERMMMKLQAVREAGEGMGQEQRRRMAARAVEEVMKEL